MYGLVGNYDQFVYVIFIQAIQYFILNIARREDYLPCYPAVVSRILSLVLKSLLVGFLSAKLSDNYCR